MAFSATVSFLILLVLATVATVPIVAATPRIDSVTPYRGSTAGGTLVTIAGSGFTSDHWSSSDEVAIDGVACTVLTERSTSNRIVCRTGAHANSGWVTATVKVGGVESAKCSPSTDCRYYFYESITPYVTEVTNDAFAGDVIRVDGRTYASEPADLEFAKVGTENCQLIDDNGESYTFYLQSNNYGYFYCQVGENAANTYDMTFSSVGYGYSKPTRTAYNLNKFNQLYGIEQKAAIDSVEPTSISAAGGSLLTIAGTGFSYDTSVLQIEVADQQAEIVSASPQTIVVRTPATDLNHQGAYAGRRGLLRERWTSIDSLAKLRAQIAAGVAPALTALTDRFEGVRKSGDWYGERISGVLQIPTAGTYSFGILGDDYGELYVATDGNPDNKQKVAYFSGATGFNYNARAGQMSDKFEFTAGQLLYVESLFQERNGDDYLQVGLLKHATSYNNDQVDIAQDEIQNVYLSVETHNEIQSISLEGNALATEQQRISLSAAVDGTGASTLAGTWLLGGSVSLSFDASAADVQAAVETLLGPGAATVTRSATTGGFDWLVSFTANANYPTLQLDSSSLSGQQVSASVQVVQDGNGPLTGSFRLGYPASEGVVYTRDLPVGAAASDVKTAIEQDILTPSCTIVQDGGAAYDLDTFETAADDWSSRNYVNPARTSVTSYCGSYSLYMGDSGYGGSWGRNFEGNTHETGQASSYSTKVYKSMCMAYRIPARTVLNMLIYVDGNWRSVRFNQQGSLSYKVVAEFPVIADDEWHYGCINLDEQLDQSLGYGFHTISGLIWYNGGGSNYLTGDFWIDEFSLTEFPRLIERNPAPVQPSDIARSVDVTQSSVASGNGVSYTVELSTFECGWQFYLLKVDAANIVGGYTATVSRVQAASEPLSGTFNLAYEGYNVTLDPRVTRQDLQATLRNAYAFPVFNGDVDVWRYQTCSSYQWRITMSGTPGDLPSLLQVDTSNTRGTGVSSNVVETVAGGIWYSSVPGQLLRTYETQPHIRVRVNEYDAVSRDSDSFVTLLDPPANYQVQAVSPAVGSLGDVLSISGTGFGSDASLLTVRFGAAECTVNALLFSDTSFSCELGQGLAGTYQVQVMRSDIGTAAGSISFEYQPSIQSVQPQPMQVSLDSRVTIFGAGFSPAPSDNVVLFNDMEVTVEESANSFLKISFPTPVVSAYRASDSQDYSLNVAVYPAGGVTPAGASRMLLARTNATWEGVGYPWAIYSYDFEDSDTLVFFLASWPGVNRFVSLSGVNAYLFSVPFARYRFQFYEESSIPVNTEIDDLRTPPDFECVAFPQSSTYFSGGTGVPPTFYSSRNSISLILLGNLYYFGIFQAQPFEGWPFDIFSPYPGVTQVAPTLAQLQLDAPAYWSDLVPIGCDLYYQSSDGGDLLSPPYTLTSVSAPASGTYKVRVYHMDSSSGNRQLQVARNVADNVYPKPVVLGEPEITTVTPATGSYLGGMAITIGCSDQCYTATSDTLVTIMYRPCVIDAGASSTNQIVCTPEARDTPVTPARIMVLTDYNDSGSRTLLTCASGYNCTFEYAADLTPTVTQVLPNVTAALASTDSQTFTITAAGWPPLQANIEGISIGGAACAVQSFSNPTVTCLLSGPTAAIGAQLMQINTTYGPGVGNTIVTMAPSILAVTGFPSSTAGGRTATINGTGLYFGSEADVAVTIGGKACQLDATATPSFDSIRCVVPARPDGQRAVSVSVSGVQSLCADQGTNCTFTYSDAITPTLSSVTPTSLDAENPNDREITVTGVGFAAGSTVTVGGLTCSSPVVAGTFDSITCTAPAGTELGAGAQLVQVLVPDIGYAKGNRYYTYPLHVTSIVPTLSSLYGGLLVTIDALGLDSSAAATHTVDFSGTPCDTFTFPQAGQMTCVTTAPGSAVIGAIISLTQNGQTASCPSGPGCPSIDFSPTGTPTIQVTSSLTIVEGAAVSMKADTVAPGQLPTGLTVSDFLVYIGEVQSTVSSAVRNAGDGSYALTVTAPYNAPGTTYEVKTQVPALGWSAAAPLNLEYVLSVDSVDPSTMSFGGGFINVNGNGFSHSAADMEVIIAYDLGSGQETVSCSILSVTISSNTDDMIRCELPQLPGLTSVPASAVAATTQVRVRNDNANGGWASAAMANSFLFDPSVTAQITSVTPTFGSTVVDNTITIAGSGFGTQSVGDIVQVGTVQFTCSSWTDVQLICTASPGTDRFPSLRYTVVQVLQISVVSTYVSSFAANNANSYEFMHLWSEGSSWQNDALRGISNNGIPVEGDSVSIPANETILLDISPPRLQLLVIEGTLYVADGVDITLDCDWVVIKGGRFEVGAEGHEHTSQFTLTLHGTGMAYEVPLYGAKVLAVHDGTLSMHGATVDLSTRLAVNAAINSTSITVADDVGWSVGDQIFVSGSAVGLQQGEEVTITATSLNGNGQRTFDITPKLDYYHHGTEEPISGAVTLDTRAEVALLTRNVKIQGDSQYSDQYQFGAHVMGSGFLGTSSIQLANVELYRVGQKGRFPSVLMYNMSIPSANYIRSCSFHTTYNRAVSLRASSNVEVSDSVAFNVIGHAFFTEDGTERNCVFQRNLAAQVKLATYGNVEEFVPACYMITHPQNDLIDNRCSDSDGYGVWWNLWAKAQGDSATASDCPSYGTMGTVSGNSAHGCKYGGVRIFPQFIPRANECDGGANAPATISSMSSFMNGQTGADLRQIGALTLDGWITADNGASSIQFRQLVADRGDANLVNSYFKSKMGFTDSTATRRGLYLGVSSGLTATGNTYVDFNSSSSSAIGVCAFCQYKEGGFEHWMSESSFENSPHRVWFTEEQEAVIQDLDGTLSDTFQPTVVLPSYALLPLGSGCDVNSLLSVGVDGASCDASQLQFHRVLVDNVVPADALEYKDMVLEWQERTATVQYSEWNSDGYVALLPMYTATSSIAVEPIIASWASGVDATQVRINTQFMAASEFFEFAVPYVQTYDHFDTFQGISAANSWDLPLQHGSYQYATNLTGYSNGRGFGPATTLFTTYVSGDSLNWKAYPCATDPCPPPPPPPLVVNREIVRWSQTSTWSSMFTTGYIPGLNSAAPDDIVVPASWDLLVDVSDIYLRNVTVNGILRFPGDSAQTMSASLLYIEGGRVLAGSLGVPITGSLTITMNGSPTDQSLMVSSDILVGSKSIGVFGQLSLHGPVPARTRSYLSADAPAGQSQISVSGTGLGWVAGDSIAVASSSFDPSEAEELVISSVSEGSDSTTLVLTSALQYFHAGSLQAYGNPVQRTANVRAEVIHLTRAITIQGDSSSEASEFGCRVYVGRFSVDDRDFIGTAELEGVRFHQCGQKSFRRNALDLRWLGQTNATYCDGCSFTHGYSSQVYSEGNGGVTISNTVAYNSWYTTFYFPDCTSFGLPCTVQQTTAVNTARYTSISSQDTGTDSAVFYVTGGNNLIESSAAGGNRVGIYASFGACPTGPRLTFSQDGLTLVGYLGDEEDYSSYGVVAFVRIDGQWNKRGETVLDFPAPVDTLDGSFRIDLDPQDTNGDLVFVAAAPTTLDLSPITDPTLIQNDAIASSTILISPSYSGFHFVAVNDAARVPPLVGATNADNFARDQVSFTSAGIVLSVDDAATDAAAEVQTQPSASSTFSYGTYAATFRTSQDVSSWPSNIVLSHFVSDGSQSLIEFSLMRSSPDDGHNAQFVVRNTTGTIDQIERFTLPYVQENVGSPVMAFTLVIGWEQSNVRVALYTGDHEIPQCDTDCVFQSLPDDSQLVKLQSSFDSVLTPIASNSLSHTSLWYKSSSPASPLATPLQVTLARFQYAPTERTASQTGAFYDNTAHSAVMGVRVLGSSTSCTGLTNTTSYYNWDYGVYGYMGNSLRLWRTHLIGNGVGALINHGHGQSAQYLTTDRIEAFDSILAGIPSAMSPLCTAAKPSSHFFTSRDATSDFVGWMGTTFTTCRTLWMDQFQRIWCNPGINGQVIIDNSVVADFGTCAGRDFVFETNPLSPDVTHPHIFTGITLSGVSASALAKIYDPDPLWVTPNVCGTMDCDGAKNVLVSSPDSTLSVRYILGPTNLAYDRAQVPATMPDILNSSLPTQDGVYRPAGVCTANAIINGFTCDSGPLYRMMVVESTDADYETRRVGPLAVSNGDYLSLLNGPADHSLCFDTACHRRLSTFFFLVDADPARTDPYNIVFSAQNPLTMRLHLLNSDENTEGMVVIFWYSNPMRVEVLRNGVVYADAGALPVTSDAAATNWWDRDNRLLYITVKGDEPISLRTIRLIQVSLTLDVTIDQFFGDEFVTNLAYVLRIDVSRIKIVNVRAGSVIVDFEIEPDPKEIAAAVTGSSSGSDSGSSGSGSSSQDTVQQPDDMAGVVTLDEVSKLIVEKASSGELASALDMPINTMAVTLPAPVPTDSSSGTDQNDDDSSGSSSSDGTDDGDSDDTVVIVGGGNDNVDENGSGSGNDNGSGSGNGDGTTPAPPADSTAPSSTPTETTSVNVALIAGAVVGGVAAVAAIVILIVVIVTKMKAAQKVAPSVTSVFPAAQSDKFSLPDTDALSYATLSRFNSLSSIPSSPNVLSRSPTLPSLTSRDSKTTLLKKTYMSPVAPLSPISATPSYSRIPSSPGTPTSINDSAFRADRSQSPL